MSGNNLFERLHDLSIGTGSRTPLAAIKRIEELEAKLAKAVKAAFFEGFRAGTADVWVNNPRVEFEWSLSRTLAELKGEKQ